MSKYEELLQHAMNPENKLELYATYDGTVKGFITGPQFRQGLFVSHTIIAVWQSEGWL